MGTAAALAACGAPGPPEAPGAPSSREPAARSASGEGGVRGPGQATMDPVALYRAVAPGVVFVETPLATGTGLLMPEGHVLTNAHVVWPYPSARLVFPAGTELLEVPVVASDLLLDAVALDLAAAGGAPAGARPIRIRQAQALAIGSPVFLLGYPGETEAFPEPAITQGILSRRRHWPAMDIDYYQSDAALAGGQSGGALVAADGSAIGLSTMRFGEDAFGLSAALPEIERRIALAMAGSDPDGIAPRTVPLSGGAKRQAGQLAHAWDEAVFVVNTQPGTTLELELEGEGDADLFASVIDPFGTVLAQIDDEAEEESVDRGEDPRAPRATRRVRRARAGAGPKRARAATDPARIGSTAHGMWMIGTPLQAAGDRESARVMIETQGPQFVSIGASPAGGFALRTSLPLAPLVDPDDGARLRPGRRAATMDYPGDYDSFLLPLDAGRTVSITVETANFLPEIILDHPEDPNLAPPIGDGAMPSALGLSSRVLVSAPVAGTYLLIVRDLDGIGTGGYLIDLE